jgi:hypothetical protein
VEYFHVTFTLPEPLAQLRLQNKREMYDLLFRATAETLQTIPADPQHLGAQIGFFCILHSWGQTLTHHPHLHCVVPGGGISLAGSRWVACRPGFFLPVKVLSERFRNVYLRYLEQAYTAGKLQFYGDVQPLSEPTNFARYLAPLGEKKWVVHAKPPFGGPERVLDYLGRYTHRVAISNNRLLELKDGQVSFTYKDYKHEQRRKVMTLSADEFLRRFLLHVLPDGFQRIRHYGLLGNRHRAENLARCRELLAVPVSIPQPHPHYRERCRQLSGQDPLLCPQCKSGQMVRIAILVPVARPVPPMEYLMRAAGSGDYQGFRSSCQTRFTTSVPSAPVPTPKNPLSHRQTPCSTSPRSQNGAHRRPSRRGHAQNRLPCAPPFDARILSKHIA